MNTIIIGLSALVAAGMARAGWRRQWMLHAVVAAVCSVALAAASALAAIAPDSGQVPGWIYAAMAGVDVLLVAVMFDLSRAGKRGDGKAAR